MIFACKKIKEKRKQRRTTTHLLILDSMISIHPKDGRGRERRASYSRNHETRRVGIIFQIYNNNNIIIIIIIILYKKKIGCWTVNKFEGGNVMN